MNDLPHRWIRAAHPIGWVGCTLLTLALTAGAASGHVEIVVDPGGVAAERGVTVFDLRRVDVAVLGSDHVEARKVVKRTLRFGRIDARGASAVHARKKVADVNGDGHRDQLFSFRMRYTGLVEGDDAYGVLRGAVRASDAFVSAGLLESPIDACTPLVDGESTVGVRCTYASSETPLNFSTLVQEINDSLDTSGSVEGDSSVVVELWGGEGHDGSKDETTTCTAHSGNGGDAGYARTVQTVDGLQALVSSTTDFYLYVGEKGPGNQHGGSASVAIGQAVTDVPDSDKLNPDAERVIAIAAGGGGGGKGTFKDIECHDGRNGGDGATAIATTDSDASTKGDDGGNDHKGHGGNGDGEGAGGAGNGGGDAGNSGIGGFGSQGEAGWAGTTLTDGDWSHGKGGEGGDGENAGGGGGGFGGGGGGQAADHKGGGGGGGSWARQALVTDEDVDEDLILGSSYDPGTPAIVLTFEVQQ